MLKNKLILRHIRVPTALTVPKTLEELSNLSDHEWLWIGATDAKGYPRFQNASALRQLYSHFKCKIGKHWKLSYPPSHNKLNVNPYHVSIANGYNYDRTSPNVQDLVEAIPQYSLTNKTPQEIYHEFHEMYQISDIEKALKILLP